MDLANVILGIKIIGTSNVARASIYVISTNPRIWGIRIPIGIFSYNSEFNVLDELYKA